MKLKNLILWVGLGLAYAIFFYFISADPFYGDAVSGNSRAAWHIFDSNFQSFLFPENFDPGHPVLIPFLNALAWKMVGPKLWVSHTINIFFSIGTVWLTYLIARKEHGEKSAKWSVILLVLTPLFVAQSAMLATHLPLTFFFLWALHSKLSGKTTQLILALSLMVLTHLQSLYLIAPLVLWDLFSPFDKENFLSRFRYWSKVLVLPGLAFALWMWYHWSQTGWAISSPDYSAHRGFPGLKRVVINLIISDWRIVDFGLVAVVIPLLISWFKKNKIHASGSLFLWLYIFNALAISITTGTGSMHRYFLMCVPMLMIWAGQYLTNKKPWLQIAVLVILASGHFWHYPGKTIGDATLTYRNIFPLLDSMNKDYPKAQIYSYAPLSMTSKWMYLDHSRKDVRPLYDQDISEAEVVLKSNVNGEFSPSDIQILNEEFEHHSYENGNIYLTVFVNKTSGLKLKGSHKHVPSALEEWMKKLKSRIKGDSGM